jgi:hypothetical protein
MDVLKVGRVSSRAVVPIAPKRVSQSCRFVLDKSTRIVLNERARGDAASWIDELAAFSMSSRHSKGARDGQVKKADRGSGQ